MKELGESLINYFNTADGDGNYSTLYGLLGGKLYRSLAPQNRTFPFCAFQFITETPLFVISGKNDAEEVLVQFNLYSNNPTSAVEIENLSAALKSLFDWANLTVDGYTFIFMRREFSRQYQDPDQVWVCSVQYRVHLEKV